MIAQMITACLLSIHVHRRSTRFINMVLNRSTMYEMLLMYTCWCSGNPTLRQSPVHMTTFGTSTGNVRYPRCRVRNSRSKPFKNQP